MDWMDEVVEVALPNGATAMVRARRLDDGGGATKAGFRERLDFDEVAAAIEGLSQAVRTAVAHVAPDAVSVELGFDLALKSGKLVGLLVDGEATGSIRVTLEWGREGGGIGGG
jgi:hypothetical protein